MYRIPVYRIQLVRERNEQTAVRQIKGPADANAILTAYLSGQDRENFVVMLLDTKHKVIGINTVSIGSLNSCPVHPRELFKPAILANANAVILCHNHPSGDPTPSAEDMELTERIATAGDLLGIPVLDHVIVGEDRYFSFRSSGLIK